MAWIRILFGMREVLVRAVGIERGGAHVFETVGWRSDEVLLGVDQAHLAFRASVLLEDWEDQEATVVAGLHQDGLAVLTPSRA